MGTDTVVEPIWRERIARYLRGRHGWGDRRILTEDLAEDYLRGLDDLPMVRNGHDCNCEYCAEPESEIDRVDPVVQGHLAEALQWVSRAITEMLYLGELTAGDNGMVLLAGDEPEIEVPRATG